MGRGASRLFSIPRMKDAESWIEVWLNERKVKDFFGQQWRGHPVKKPKPTTRRLPCPRRVARASESSCCYFVPWDWVCIIL